MDRMSLIYRGAVPDLVCCEVILRVMPDGEWAAFIQTGGPTEPHPDNDVFISRSRDRGATWSAPERIWELEGKATYQTEVMVHEGAVTVFVTTHDGKFLDWEHWSSVSRDGGRTWGPMQPAPHKPRETFIRNLFTKASGELVLPFQHYDMDAAELAAFKREGRRIMDSRTAQPENGVLISRDNGRSWSGHGSIRIPTTSWIWAENNVVELSDGSMVMLIRADGAGVLYRSDSPDGGLTWGPPYRSDIANPGSKIRLFKLLDGRIVLLHNPSPFDKDRRMLARNPLSLWVSRDDMRSWYHKRDLVTFPGWLSYPDGFVDEDEGYVHFAFDYNKHDAIYVGAKLPD
jgi:predicted neuraminidase